MVRDTVDRQVFLERRFLTALISFSICMGMLNPFLLIMFVPDSLTAKVAGFTSAPGLIGIIFLLCAVCMVPGIVAAVLGLPNRRYMRMSCLSLCAASFMWVGMAYLCRYLDASWIALQYLQNGLMALLFAAAFASILNNQMKVLRRERELA